MQLVQEDSLPNLKIQNNDRPKIVIDRGRIDSKPRVSNFQLTSTKVDTG